MALNPSCKANMLATSQTNNRSDLLTQMSHTHNNTQTSKKVNYAFTSVYEKRIEKHTTIYYTLDRAKHSVKPVIHLHSALSFSRRSGLLGSPMAVTRMLLHGSLYGLLRDRRYYGWVGWWGGEVEIQPAIGLTVAGHNWYVYIVFRGSSKGREAMIRNIIILHYI